MRKIPLRKTRIMQITHDLAIGGLQQVVVNICNTIDRTKFDILVLCLRNLGEFANEIKSLGIEVICLPQKECGTDYFTFLKVAKILKDRRIDVIHTHNTQPLIDGTLGALLSGVKTIVHTDHARQFPDKKRYMFAERVMSHFVHRMVGVSDPTSKDLVKYEKISPRKIITIMNGIDGGKFAIEIDKEKKKHELGIKNKGKVIGLGVRLSEEKGVIYLLRAMLGIIRLYPSITLVVAGKGECEEALKETVYKMGIAGNVLFIGPRLDMPELLKLFDIYVLPSIREGLPTVLLEAMAAECPIVATDVGGNYMVIKHKENGSLVEARNPGALTAEIIRLLKDENLRKQYAINGLKVFREKFDARIMMNKYEQLYMRK